jgi:16S rRNA C1402 (ribose-2'-O) methylase RsmI
MSEAKEFLHDRQILLTVDLTQDTEKIYEGFPGQIFPQVEGLKAEFMLLVYPR